MPFALTQEREKRLQELLDRYPNRQAACIPALHLCQEQSGVISDEIAQWLGARLGISAAQVLGVATFYSLLSTEGVGRHRIWVCRTLGCALQGADRLLAHIEQRLGIHAGETTPDGRITLDTAECLASCGSGPVVQIDRRYLERATVADVDAALDELLAEPAAPR